MLELAATPAEPAARVFEDDVAGHFLGRVYTVGQVVGVAATGSVRVVRAVRRCGGGRGEETVRTLPIDAPRVLDRVESKPRPSRIEAVGLVFHGL